MEGSSFMKLPLEIRRMIYQYHLKARYVRQYPDPSLVVTNEAPFPGELDSPEETTWPRDSYKCGYDFQTSIMRVNKQIYQETRDMLYHENHFLTLFCNRSILHSSMLDHNVALLLSEKPKIVAKFKYRDVALHLHVSASSHQKITERRRTIAQSCLMVADEMPKFVRMLPALQANLSIDLCFHIRNGSSVVQRRILDPFRILTIDRQSFIFTGSINDSLERSLRATMTPEVKWSRGRAWENYYFAKSLFEDADEAFRLGDIACAIVKYTQYMDTKVAVAHQDPMEPEPYDESNLYYMDSYRDLCFVFLVNGSLAYLYSEDWENARLSAAEAWQCLCSVGLPALKPVNESLMYHCHAIALAAEQKETEALEHLVKAQELGVDTEVLLDHLKVMRKRLSSKSSAAKDAIGTIFSRESIKRLDKLASVAPLIHEPSADIAGERYILRHFGYQGDFFDEITESAPADIEKMGEIIHKMEKERADSDPGKACVLWIKPPPLAGPPSIQYHRQ